MASQDCSHRKQAPPSWDDHHQQLDKTQKEDVMSDTTPALDEAFERIAAASFELPNGFVNHGAMACEALAILDCADDIDSWARRFAQAGGARIDRWRRPALSGGMPSARRPSPGVDRILRAGH